MLELNSCAVNRIIVTSDEEDNGEEGKEVDVRVDLTDRSCEELVLCRVLVLMTG